MSKIKLSILLLISFSIFSCTNNQINYSTHKYSLAYISGEYDGLLLRNFLMSNLLKLDIYDKNSNIEIQANVSHSSNLYVTNTDNTSDREKISTKLSVQIFDKISNCEVFKSEINVSQFYIYAPSDKFLSNQTAVKKIKKNNTESTARQFIKQLKNIENKCNE